MDNNQSIMVVDDNPLVLRNIKQVLGDKYQCYLMPSGKQALNMLKKQKVDLILLDYEMPEMDGIETFRQLHANKDTTDIPVVFLTAVADKHKTYEALKCHPAGYMLKPIDTEKLKEEIYDILNKV